ncbi:MAG: 1-acyl-sn-glycerol-3-phosphate acyltransferase [Puniceicoccaceae bacterium]|nr:MAG: 1-acyl-sn-glycerol-3-phosphate acyltransferase [Puniceicoccaceae bacterium]
MTPAEGVYWFCHYWCASAHRVLFPGEVSGVEHIPAEGPFIIASNHASFLDPPLLGCHFQRQLVFFARRSLFKPGLASWWLRTVRTIPVDRDGEADVAALRQTIAALKAGRPLVLFPEGTRSTDGTLGASRPGVGLIACRTTVPVIPARLFGTFEAFGRHRRLPRLGTAVDVVYGPPMPPEEYDPGREAGKDRYVLAAARIWEAVKRLDRPRAPVV